MEHDIQDRWGNEECIQNILIENLQGRAHLRDQGFKFKDNTKIRVHENVKWIKLTPGGFA
jgi:hypothetical protein